MIIVSQDKEEIVNFENIENIWISNDGEGRFTIEATATTNSTLGHYKIKERAKEILQEIVRRINGKCEIFHNANELKFESEASSVYEMPED